jgi:hypothetical protein
MTFSSPKGENYINFTAPTGSMTKEELKAMKEQNQLLKELVLGIKQVIQGKTKPLN